VGIDRTSNQFLRNGVPWYLLLLGLISMSDALFNLLPLLPLDGGNIVVSLVEGLRRRPVPQGVYRRLSTFGTALIILITLIALSNDIGPSPH
jgi:regulator of sigma E protease